MSATVHNVQRVTLAIQAEGEGLVRALTDEMAAVAEEMVRLLKHRAPKWQSTLTNDIRKDQTGPERFQVGAYAAHAAAAETGRGPGKSLPRWSDPAAASIKAWLTSKAFKGRTRGRRGSARAALEALELRDRYQGLAWHVRRHGIKPHPFFKPTVEQMERVFPARLADAGREYLARFGAAAEGVA